MFVHSYSEMKTLAMLFNTNMCIANTLTQGVQIFNIELQLSATCPVVSMLTFFGLCRPSKI